MFSIAMARSSKLHISKAVFLVICCFSCLLYSGNIWCSPEHACLFLVTHINCSSGAYTMEKTCFKCSSEGISGIFIGNIRYL